jgi:hypothetical protein
MITLQTRGFLGNPRKPAINTVPVPAGVRCSQVRVRVRQNIPGGYPCHTLVVTVDLSVISLGLEQTYICTYLEASKATWHSSVYNHFNITLHHKMGARGRSKILSFVFSCKVDPAHYSANICA